jgi:hypothetical protein
MTELELARTPGDRRRYALGDVGTLRLQGLASRSAAAEAEGGSWSFSRRGLFGRAVEAHDSTQTVVGAYEPRTVRRGGLVRWDGRELALRPASSWRERYALADGDRELALFDGKGWGSRPVKVSLGDPDVDPGLLLFTAFVVRGLAEDASAAAGGGAAAAVSG